MISLLGKNAFAQTIYKGTYFQHRQQHDIYSWFLKDSVIIVEEFEHINVDTWYRLLDTLHYKPELKVFQGLQVQLQVHSNYQILEIFRGQKVDVIKLRPASISEWKRWNYRKNQTVLSSYAKWFKQRKRDTILQRDLNTLDSLANEWSHVEFLQMVEKLRAR